MKVFLLWRIGRILALITIKPLWPGLIISMPIGPACNPSMVTGFTGCGGIIYYPVLDCFVPGANSSGRLFFQSTVFSKGTGEFNFYDSFCCFRFAEYWCF
jgi:hypothetical protein